jgi:hypothetical protein
MSMLYTCDPQHITQRGIVDAERIVVGWSAGEGLYGPGAQVLCDLMASGWVNFGGYPRAVVPAPQAITSLEDFALVLGDSWVLPLDLAKHYPKEVRQDAPPGLCF